MAGSLNKVMLIGRLGQDPELKYTQSGSPVCNISLATDETYTARDGNRVEKTEWHRLVLFDRQAETAANYLRKGRLIFVEGSLQTRKWQDQQGQDRYTTEIKVQRFQFLESKGGADQAPYQGGQQQGYQQAPPQNGGYGGGQQQGGYQQGGGQQQGGYQQQSQQQQAPQQEEDMGPAFPSEASGMDDVPF